MSQAQEGAPGASPRTYPLTFSQNAMFMAWKYSIHKAVMNVPTVFFVDQPLDFDLMRQAAEQAIARNDAFAIRIAKIDGKWRQYFGERKALVLETKDFTGRSEADMEAFFRKTGETPMHLSNRPLAKIYLVRSPSGKCGIYSCISHLMMDSWAIFLFYKDTMAIYFSLRDGEPMPKPLHSCESVLQKELAYIESPRYAEDKAFWVKVISNPDAVPFATHINGSIVLERQRRKRHNPEYRYMQAFRLRSKAAHEVLTIPKADVDRMKTYCEEQNFPPMPLILMFGIRTFLAKVNGRTDRVSVFNVVSRRSTLEEKQSGGSRVHFPTFTTIMGEGVTFREGLDIMRAKQDQVYRHANFNPLGQFDIDREYLRFPATETYHAMAITFTPTQIDFGHGLHVETKWFCNGSAGQELYLTVMDDDGSGALRCYYEYYTSCIKPERIRLCHNFALRVIRAGIANPEITLKELIDMPLEEATNPSLVQVTE